MIADLAPAFNFVFSPSTVAYYDASDRPTLQGSGRPIFVLPGNHDRFHTNLGEPACTNFEKTFTTNWAQNGQCVRHVVFEKTRARLAIVCADFCLRHEDDAEGQPRWISRFGQGRAYEDTLHELRERTTKLQHSSKPTAVAWAVHFPPMGEPSSRHKLLNGISLIEAAEQLGIAVMLAGHFHTSEIISIASGKILVAGTSCAVDAQYNNWIHVIEIDVSTDPVQLNREDYRWNKKQQNFELRQTHRL
jgi:hypothetical protein